MKTVFCTYVTDNAWLERLARPLQASAKYFHPEIPFRIFSPAEVDSFIKRCPYLPNAPHGCIKSAMGKELSKDFDRVVIFDADSLIVAELTELLEAKSDLAGVRAFADHGALQRHPPEHPGIKVYTDLYGREKYLNGGLFSCRNPIFWDDWDKMNREIVRNLFNLEEGTLNRLVYGKYSHSFSLLDPLEALYYYGQAASWGSSSPWDSWKTIELEEDKLYLKNIYGIKKQVKVLHEAAHGQMGSPDNRFNIEQLFPKAVGIFLRKVLA